MDCPCSKGVDRSRNKVRQGVKSVRAGSEMRSRLSGLLKTRCGIWLYMSLNAEARVLHRDRPRTRVLRSLVARTSWDARIWNYAEFLEARSTEGLLFSICANILHCCSFLQLISFISLHNATTAEVEFSSDRMSILFLHNEQTTCLDVSGSEATEVCESHKATKCLLASLPSISLARQFDMYWSAT